MRWWGAGVGQTGLPGKWTTEFPKAQYVVAHGTNWLNLYAIALDALADLLTLRQRRDRARCRPQLREILSIGTASSHPADTKVSAIPSCNCWSAELLV